MNKKWSLLSLIMLFLFLAGCTTNRDAANESPNLTSNRAHSNNDFELNNRAKDKQHYVEDDITGQNPNFLDLNRTGSGSESGAGNHAIDTDKAKQVIADTHEFVTDSVWIKGDRMRVTVYKKGSFSNRERKADEVRLRKKLMEALPLYNIEVRVKEDQR